LPQEINNPKDKMANEILFNMVKV